MNDNECQTTVDKKSYLTAFRGHREKLNFGQIVCESAAETWRNNLKLLVLNSLVIFSLVWLSALPEDEKGTSFQNVASLIKTVRGIKTLLTMMHLRQKYSEINLTFS